MPKGLRGFQKGNKLSPGRAKGSLNKFTQVKQDMVDIWAEENGKEKFRGMFQNDLKRALKEITTILPKDVKVGGDEESGPIRIVFRAARPQAESKAG